MKNALLVTLGILLLAIAGFAGTVPVAPGAAPDTPVAVGNRAEDAPDMTPLIAPSLIAAPRTSIDAKQCETRAETSASDDIDACAECQLDCMAEWRRCRRNCGTDDWYDCHDGCVGELIWCQNTGCAHVCDSSGAGRLAK